MNAPHEMEQVIERMMDSVSLTLNISLRISNNLIRVRQGQLELGKSQSEIDAVDRGLQSMRRIMDALQEEFMVLERTLKSLRDGSLDRIQDRELALLSKSVMSVLVEATGLIKDIDTNL